VAGEEADSTEAKEGQGGRFGDDGEVAVVVQHGPDDSVNRVARTNGH